MRPTLRFLISAVAFLTFTSFVYAQGDDSQPPVIVLGGFNFNGSATAGYRFDDIKGYRPQFQEMFDLNKGLRLLDFSLFGTAPEGKNAFADTFSLQLSGLGGDPFPSAQFAISKNKVYDFRVDWRQSYYYWNQNDNVVLPIAAATTGLGTGLTNNHNWATVRKFGNVDLTIHATNNLRFRFNYYRTSDEGTTYTTRSLDFLDSPGYWGTFARANPYYLYAPLSDYTDRFTGGLDYSYKTWSFHYSVGYQTFTEGMTLNNVSAPELSINPILSSTREPLSNLSWSQFRKLTTPIDEFSYVGKPLSKLEWRGGYMFYRYTGPATMDSSFNGIAPNATSVLTPYTVSQSGRASVTEPDNIITQGLTYHLYHWWNVDLDYRYSRFTSRSVGDFSSLFNSTTPSTATTDAVWRDGISDLVFRMDFTPIPSLLLRPGVQLMKTDVEALTNGVVDPEITLRTKTVEPDMSFSYDPSQKFNIRGDFHVTDNGSSYTAIAPHTQQGTRFVLRYRPMAKLSVEDEVNIVNNKLLTTDFRNNVRANATTVSYSLGNEFSIFAGFSYESYYAQGDIVYARGTPPLNDFLRDQEINRVWSAGVEARPMKRVGFRLSGNYDRSNGVGAISGEPPAYGPSTWPLITGTAYYDFPIAGRLAIDLQRTYYSEQIVPVNNFGANLLTIKWTRNF
jgi:hypothetical protein